MYHATIKIEFGCTFDAKNKQDAISYLKDNFDDDYGIDLQDSEIIKLEVIKWIAKKNYINFALII